MSVTTTTSHFYRCHSVHQAQELRLGARKLIIE